jgi:hypothetical protein
VYILLADAWFIAPQRKQNAIFLRPGIRKSKNHKYEEAWHLLRSEIPSATTTPDTRPADGNGDAVAPLS